MTSEPSVTAVTVAVAECPPGRPPARWVARDPDRRVVVVVPDGGAGGAHIGSEVLAAVGVRPDLKGNAEQHRHRNPGLAATWLAAHRTRFLVIASPAGLPGESLETFWQIARAGGATLVLAGDHGTSGTVVGGLPASVPTVRWTTEEAVTALQAHRVAGAEEEPSADPLAAVRPGDLPPVDFTSWRAECRRALPRTAFDALDTAYVDARAAAHRRAQDGEVTPADVDALVLRLSAGRPGLAAGVAVVRGVQAGMFREGWFVQADHDRLVAGLSRQDRQPLTVREWRSLGGWRIPAHAAAVTLHVSDVTLGDMAALTVADAAEADTAPHGEPFTVAGHAVDPRGRPWVAGLRTWRIREGTAADDALFPAPTVAGLARLLREARGQLGLPVAEPKVASETRRGARAVTALGLTVRRLPVPEDAGATEGRP